jgi:hypothetical protein
VPTERSRCHFNIEKGDWDMVILGIDAQQRTHTVVVIDERGRELGSKTTKAATTADHLELLPWAQRFSGDRDRAAMSIGPRTALDPREAAHRRGRAPQDPRRPRPRPGPPIEQVGRPRSLRERNRERNR